MPVRVLFSCLPGFGHFNPLVPLARASARAGHQVAVATAAEFCSRVADAGFEAFPTGLGMGEQLRRAALAYPTQAAMAPGEARFESFVPAMLAGVAAPARAADLVPLARRWRPDVVVHDEAELAGPIAAAVVGVAWASHSVVLRRPEVMARLAGQVIAPVAARYGVDVGPMAGLYRYLHFDACPPSLQDRSAPHIAVAHLVANTDDGDTAAGDIVPAWLAGLAGRPTVYVTLGMLFNRRELLAAILEGVAGEAVNVIATVGADNVEALTPQPAHVRLEAYSPLSQLLGAVDVVVTQGGTSILSALSAGLPLLVLPQGADQFHNAAACVAAGVGLRLLPGQVDAATVAASLRRLLDEAAFADAARAIQIEMASMPGPDAAVELLERLAAHAQPIPAPGSDRPR